MEYQTFEIEDGAVMRAGQPDFMIRNFVVSTSRNASSSSSEFSSDNEIFVSFSPRNGGSASGMVGFSILIDGKEYMTDNFQLNGGSSINVSNINLGHLAAGDHVITVICDRHEQVEESDETNNSLTMNIHVDEGTTGNWAYLMESSWVQNGDGNGVGVYDYNRYVPDGGLTGCVPTVWGQLIYYWAKLNPNMSLTVSEEDYFDVNNGTTNVRITSENMEEYCGISLTALNDALSSITYDEANWDSDGDIAALNLACMMICHSEVKANFTGTSVSASSVGRLKERANLNGDLIYIASGDSVNWEAIQQSVDKGSPVICGLKNLAHAVIVDGYNTVTGMYHVNFGWENKRKTEAEFPTDFSNTQNAYALLGSGWYTQSEMEQMGLNYYIANVAPVKKYPVLTISCDNTNPLQQSYVAATVEGADTIYFSIDNQNWEEYTGQIDVTANGTYHFKATNFDGTTYANVTFNNIDRVPPNAPVASLSTERPTHGSVTVSATFSNDSNVKEYSLDGETWLAYVDSVRMTVNGSVYFRGTDAAGNVSEVTECAVTNIEEYISQVSEDWSYVNCDFAVDASDYKEITLESAAKLSFSCVSESGAKFTIWTGNSDSGKMKKVQSTSLKLDKKTGEYVADTKALLLDKGQYFISVESAKKNVTSAEYSITLKNDDSVFFTKGDNTDDTFEDVEGGETNAIASTVLNAAKVSGNSLAEGWVGFGDVKDFYTVDLSEGAWKLQFNVKATDAAKFIIWQVVEKEKNGVMTRTLKSVQSTTLKGNKDKTEYLATTKALLMNKGQYFISVESTNAKKGGNADYTISVNPNSFAYEVDNADDNVHTGADVADFNPAGTSGWVGFGDDTDYYKFQLDTAANLQFNLSGEDASKFTIWREDPVTGRMKSVQSTTLKLNKNLGHFAATSKAVLVTAGTYYVSINSTNAKKGGSTHYSVVASENYQELPAGDNSDDTYKLALEKDAVALGEAITGWVGFGDKADFLKVSVESDGQLSLMFDDVTRDAVKNKQLKVTLVNAKGKSQSLIWNEEDEYVTKAPIAAGDYFVGMTTANEKKYYNLSYSVTVN